MGEIEEMRKLLDELNNTGKVEIELAKLIVEKRLAAANLIIGLHGIPKMCSQCKWESKIDFFCSILNIPGNNDKRAEKCPYDVFEGKA